MIILRSLPTGLVASSLFVSGLFYAADVASATDEVMLVNAETGKCLTIAGGTSAANNVIAVQFNCDSHPSRQWRLNRMSDSNVYKIRNMQTGKCLTIAGGTSTANNVEAVQFDCDSHPSRQWTIRSKTTTNKSNPTTKFDDN